MSYKDKFKGARRAPTVVPIEGLGDVRIRAFTLGELRKLEAIEGNDARALFVLSAVVDEDGNPVFTSLADLEDTDISIIHDLSKAVMKVSNPSIEDEKKS